MSQRRSLARPYAEAVFRLAVERGTLQKWSEMLAIAAAVAGDERVRAAVNDPLRTREQIAELFLDICGRWLDAEAANFVRVLAENRRLTLLPEIAALFEERRAEAEGRLQAKVVSAFPLTKEQEQAVARALERRLGRRVVLESAVDPKLLGGIVVRIGDLVIDGSVRGRVERLAAQLSH